MTGGAQVVMAEAGLIRREKDRRVRRCAFRADGLGPARDRIESHRRFWEEGLDALAAHLECDEPPSPPRKDPVSTNPVDTADAIRPTRLLPAPPARVFHAWTREEHRLGWACPKGATLLSAGSDPGSGGGPDGEDQRMGETLVTVEFVPMEGGTEVRLVHSGFPAPESRDGHGEAWASCLERLEELLA